MQAGSTFKIFTLIAAPAAGRSAPRPSSTAPAPVLQRVQGLRRRDRRPAPGGVTNFGHEQFGNIDLRTRDRPLGQHRLRRSSTSRSARQKTKDAAVAAGLPAKGARARTTPTSSAPSTSRYRHGQRLRHHRRPGPAGRRRTSSGASRAAPATSTTRSRSSSSRSSTRTSWPTPSTRCSSRSRTARRRTRQNLGRPAAGKTGTSDDNKSAWFNGFTPQLATSVGIYRSGKNGKPSCRWTTSPGVGELTGGTVPVRIWTDYMKAALEGQKVLEFPQRAGVGDDQVYPRRPRQTSSTPALVHHDDHDDATTTTTTTRRRRPTSARPQRRRRPRRPPADGAGTRRLTRAGGARADRQPPRDRTGHRWTRRAARWRWSAGRSGAMPPPGRRRGWRTVRAAARRRRRRRWRCRCPAGALHPEGWIGSDQFWHACFSDLPALYQLGNLEPGLASYVGRRRRPGRPPGAHGCGHGLGRRPRAGRRVPRPDPLVLRPLGGPRPALLVAVTVYLTAASRPRHAADAAQVAAEPGCSS